GKRLLVDKTPRYYQILPELSRLFPTAHQIWLKRSPLDVIASCKNTWGLSLSELLGEPISPHSFDTTVALSLLSAHFSNVSSPSFCLRYEDLVADPARF